MNNTSNNSENPSEKSTTLPYYYIGFSFAFILFVIFIPIYFSYCNHTNSRNRHQSAAGSNNRTVVFMERDHTTEVNIEEREATLNSYPVLLYSEIKLHKPADSTSLICSICLADYKDSEWLRLLSDCGHFFHKECVATWFRLNMSCPMCRNSPLPTSLAQVTPVVNYT
ncbi:RING-H2 finger protein ATL70-like [Trifolium pratense]|uniref:RING-H2 finger protein ATL70-like n=1 Tax=Trifolium pratense TaxID=57577 RepID=UPI001E695309|nr:RING-H2 finger protein ATL70-like [Trifolium pratense]